MEIKKLIQTSLEMFPKKEAIKRITDYIDSINDDNTRLHEKNTKLFVENLTIKAKGELDAILLSKEKDKTNIPTLNALIKDSMLLKSLREYHRKEFIDKTDLNLHNEWHKNKSNDDRVTLESFIRTAIDIALKSEIENK